jgi:hypothetical protein
MRHFAAFKYWTVLPLLLMISGAAFAERVADDNLRYQYPLTIGIEFQGTKPLADFATEFDLYGVSGNIRLPVHPLFQLSLDGGVTWFTSRDMANPRKWSHYDAYGLLGLFLSYRFNKTFEASLGLSGGASLSVYPDLVPEGAVSSPNLLVQAGMRFAVNLNYSLAVEIHPGLTYARSFSPLDEFNGFSGSIGSSLHLRLGDDPDLVQRLYQCLSFTDTGIPPLFAAMQGHYAVKPITSVRLTNSENSVLSNLEVSFFQKGFMDSPTPCCTVKELGPGQSAEADLFASFNNEIFQTEGTVPMVGEIIVSYRVNGRTAEQRKPVSYLLHDKTAITWDDDRKAAAFITPSDTALRNFTSHVRQTCRDSVAPGYNANVQFAAQLFYALAELGVMYSPDPASPFLSVKGKTMEVDSVSLPRSTLKRITGDCDDLTVLFCSLLESAGIETGYIATSSHIYPAFNTQAQVRDFGDIHTERAQTLPVGNSLWIPVEITMLGSATFLEAWQKGIGEYRALDTAPDGRHFVMTRQAQETYKPVGLKEEDSGIQYGRTDPVIRNSLRDITGLKNAILERQEKITREEPLKENWNALGIRYARFGYFPKARDAFEKAMALDGDYAAAKVNLAVLQFLDNNYSQALSLFRPFMGPDAALDRISRITVLFYAARCYSALGNEGEAAHCLTQASQIDAAILSRYTLLTAQGKGDRTSLLTESADAAFAE